MVHPTYMCRQHLLGEHVEIHMLVAHLKRGRSIDGFLKKGLLEPQYVHFRHLVLVEEMLRRGYNHASPLDPFMPRLPWGHVDAIESLRELSRRCYYCRQRIDSRTLRRIRP